MKNTMKKIGTRLIAALMLCMVTLTAFDSRAFAATSGGANEKKITVVTKSDWRYPGSESITLKQNKQTLTYRSTTGGKEKTKTGYYGYYVIKVYNETDDKTSTIKWDGGQTKKITLKSNKTYKITVTYDWAQTYLNQLGATPWFNTMVKCDSPSWYVSATWKVSSYS